MTVDALIANFKDVVTNHYFDFNGRVRRQTFWYYVLVLLVLDVGLAIIGTLVGLTNILIGLLGLALLPPSLGLAVRRLHDTDRSGWWFFIQLIPIVGGIVLLVFACLEGTRGPNRFGADPKLEATTGEQPDQPAMPV